MKNKKTLQIHLLQHSSCTEAEEVQVDSQATVKPIFLKTEGGTIQVKFEKSLSLSILVNPHCCIPVGCEADLGIYYQGGKHGRLGASQLKVTCPLCTTGYEQ